MRGKGERTGSNGGARSPDPGRVGSNGGARSPGLGSKAETPLPPMDTPGSNFREVIDSQRPSRMTMSSPSDVNKEEKPNEFKGIFTGRSTLKNPFG